MDRRNRRGVEKCEIVMKKKKCLRENRPDFRILDIGLEL